jgi:hypothetical protein
MNTNALAVNGKEFQIPPNVHVRRAVLHLLRRIELCIDVNPDAVVKTFSVKKLSRMQQSNGLYKVRFVRTGVLYDSKWFSGRNCSAWLPNMVDELMDELIFTCNVSTPGVSGRFPRRCKIEGRALDDIGVLNASSNGSHKVRIVVDGEVITAHLKRVNWNDRNHIFQILVGRGAMTALPMPSDVLGRIAQFLDIDVTGMRRISGQNNRRRVSMFPYTLKCVGADHLGLVTK